MTADIKRVSSGVMRTIVLSELGNEGFAASWFKSQMRTPLFCVAIHQRPLGERSTDKRAFALGADKQIVAHYAPAASAETDGRFPVTDAFAVA